MKYLKRFKLNENQEAGHSKEVARIMDLPDNREVAQVGDQCVAIWFNEDTYHLFTIEDLKYADDDQEVSEDDPDEVKRMGLGFDSEDTVYDIGFAYHAVVLKKHKEQL